MTSCRIPTKTVHWLVKRNAAGQRIPVRGPFRSISHINETAFRYDSATWATFEVQTFVYDQFGAVITD